MLNKDGNGMVMHDIEEGAPITVEPSPAATKYSYSKRGSASLTANGSDESTSNSSDNNGSKHGSNKKDDDSHENGQDDKHHGHHAANNPTYKSLIASSVVCFVIYFVFCIVFSSVVWDPLNSSLDTNIDPPFGVSQGVGINLMGIAVGSVFFAWKSGCKAIIAGPDLLPVVFFAEAGVSVVTYLAANSVRALDSDCADDGYGDGTGSTEETDYHRFLGGGEDYTNDANPCNDIFHRNLAGDELYLDESSISKVVPTTLVAMMIGNLVTSLLFYGLGKMKNTASVIGCIPASVVAGFLTCIGYKVRLMMRVILAHDLYFNSLTNYLYYLNTTGHQASRIDHNWILLQAKIH